jgi:hypothetical protein
MKQLTLDESDIDCLETLAAHNEGVAMFTALLPALEAEPSGDGDEHELRVTQEAANRLSEALHRATIHSHVDEQTRVAAAILIPRLGNLPPVLQGMSEADVTAFLNSMPVRE